MLFSLIATSFIIDNSVVNNSFDKTIKDTPQYPSVCQSTFDISTIPLKTMTLEMHHKYCFKIQGSIFINGDSVHMTGYRNNVIVMQGEGVFATIGYEKTDKNYVVMLEADETEDVTLIGSIRIPNGYIYLTTKNKLDKFNLLQKNTYNNGIYSTPMLILGPKNDIEIEVDPDASSIIEYSLLGQIGTYTNDREFLFANAIIINSWSSSSKGEAIIEFESNGNDWETPFDGYIDVSENKVYRESDIVDAIKEGGLSSTMMTVAISLSVVGFIIIIIVCCCCYCCCCRKSKKNSSSSSSSSSSSRHHKQLQDFNNGNQNYPGNYQPPPQQPQQPPQYPQIYQQPPLYDQTQMQIQPQYGQQMQPSYAQNMPPQYNPNMQPPPQQQFDPNMQNPYGNIY